MKAIEDDSDLEGTNGFREQKKKKKKKEERTTVTTIPEEIIVFDILTRIPVKSLLRFRCVSKLCRSVLRNPSFVNLHLSRSMTDRFDGFGLFVSAYNKHSSELHLLSASHCGGATTHLFTLPNSNSDPCVSLHLNGLFLVHRTGFSCINPSIYICNPSTREIAKLPSTGPIVYSPSVQHVCYNLGLDLSTNEYKVLNIRVRNLRCPEKMQAECEIFTLSTNSWRKIDPVFPFDVKGQDCFHGWCKESLCVNGIIHWMIWSKKVIVAFDLKEEKFRVLPLPPAAIPFEEFTSDDFPVKSNTPYMIQINGLLGLICHEHVLKRNSMEIWILEDYKNQVWIEERIAFPSGWAELGRPYPCGAIHTGEILLTPQRISRDREEQLEQEEHFRHP
ncbi:hypothetical protein F0562_032827 [Nyssa sinensis]|uniref:F-box domain-containing protein n=1 Tax=Nyssa sinensis TaxID=561372 RepID=A0A5J5AR06_9ASTE|nr:hypothetical protein F0562_032827 [Nyssa sinensis]